MVNDIIEVIKLMLDRDAWGRISDIFDALSRKQADWQEEVRSAKATFTCRERFKVGAFLNQLIDDGIRRVGVSRTQVDNFIRIFNEIVDNAFRYGCQNSPSGKVNVLCFYSRWFIYLEVEDPGKGFNLAEEVRKKRQSSADRGIAHGLQVVETLAYELFTNKSGNSVTAILNGQPAFEVVPTLETFDGKEILLISVLSDDAWYGMIEDWRPLYEVISNASQKLFLIDLSEIHWPSRVLISVVEGVTRSDKVSSYPEQPGSRFAFLINRGAHSSFGLSRYEEARPPIFREDQRTQAKAWLANGE